MPPDSKSPLDTLKAILAAAAELKQKKTSAAAHKQQVQDHNANMIPIDGAQMSLVFFSWDGDGIGNSIARAERSNDPQKVSEMSRRIEAGQLVLLDWVVRANGKIVQSGGDEGLAQVNSKALETVEEARDSYRKAVGATLSIGVGADLKQATEARMLAKLKGKNQILQWNEATAHELEIRMAQAGPGDDASKMKAAMEASGEQTMDQAGRDIKPEEQEEHSGEKQSENDSNEQEQPEDVTERRQGAKPQSQAPENVTERGPAEPKKQPERRKVANVTADSHYDPDIEAMDFSHHDDPEFEKRLWYRMKHGNA